MPSLAEKPEGIGVKDTPVNLRNKLARGKFSAVFLLQALAALSSGSGSRQTAAIRSARTAAP